MTQMILESASIGWMDVQSTITRRRQVLGVKEEQDNARQRVRMMMSGSDSHFLQLGDEAALERLLSLGRLITLTTLLLRRPLHTVRPADLHSPTYEWARACVDFTKQLLLTPGAMVYRD